MVYQSRPTLNATRARQGRMGRHMIWVLLVGTVLATIGLFAAWTWKAPDLAATAKTNDKQISDSRAFDTAEPAPIATPSTKP